MKVTSNLNRNKWNKCHLKNSIYQIYNRRKKNVLTQVPKHKRRVSVSVNVDSRNNHARVFPFQDLQLICKKKVFVHILQIYQLAASNKTKPTEKELHVVGLCLCICVSMFVYIWE